jgi:hypothetical protein
VPALASALALAACGSGHITSQAVVLNLNQIRAAVSKYDNVAAAVAAGYRPTPFCAKNPFGPGAAGIHYVNFSLFNRSSIDPLQPDQLLYQPGPNGTRTLVGVEYHEPDRGQAHPAVPGLGHMDGPAPALYPGDTTHFALHVWLFRTNPDGVFAPWNPNVQCDPRYYRVLSIAKAGGGR